VIAGVEGEILRRVSDQHKMDDAQTVLSIFEPTFRLMIPFDLRGMPG
jgi:hypothetical protein